MKNLIKKYELSSYYYNDAKNKKEIEAIAADLYQYVDPTGWNERHHVIFWQMVKLKISCLKERSISK